LLFFADKLLEYPLWKIRAGLDGQRRSSAETRIYFNKFHFFIFSQYQLNCNNPRACAELSYQLDGPMYDSWIFNHLALADFACPCLDSLSWYDTSRLKVKIDEDIAGDFLTRDEFLNDAVRDFFCIEDKFLTIFDDGGSSACVTVPGLQKAGISEIFLGKRLFYAESFGSIETVFDKKFESLSFILTYIYSLWS
jgi:hypothetical protein